MKRRHDEDVGQLEAATIQDNDSTRKSLGEPAPATYRILSPYYVDDSQCAVLFAEGVKRELSNVRAEENEAISCFDAQQTPYGFFGRTEFLKKLLKREDTKDLSITLGVTGSAKSRVLLDYLLEAFNGEFRRSHGTDPSVLVAAETNEQCKKLLDLISGVSQTEGSLVPPPLWYVDKDSTHNSHAMTDILRTTTKMCDEVDSKDRCTESVQENEAILHTLTEEPRNVFAGNLHPLDLRWRLNARVIDALVKFSRTLHEIYIFDNQQRDLEQLFTQLSSWADVQGLLLKATGLAADRQRAHDTSGTLLNVLKMKEAELELRHQNLMKIVAEVIRDFEDVSPHSQPVRDLSGVATNVARPLLKFRTEGQAIGPGALYKRGTRSLRCEEEMMEKQGIHICTHDFATQYITEEHFDVVILSDVGVLDVYKGSSLLGLARHRGKLVGDPLQGARPCTSLADTHLYSCMDFKVDSLRCPQIIMTLVQAAYRAKLRDPSLTLTGVQENGNLFLHTDYDRNVIRDLLYMYRNNLLVIGFTSDVVADVTRDVTIADANGALHIDSVRGQSAAIVVVIMEKAHQARSPQYDVKRLVPALTRCSHSLLVMWQTDAYKSVPWNQIRSSDGAYELFGNLVTKFEYISDGSTILHLFRAAEITKRLPVWDNRVETSIGKYDVIERGDIMIASARTRKENKVLFTEVLSVDSKASSEANEYETNEVRMKALPERFLSGIPQEYKLVVDSLIRLVEIGITHMVIEDNKKQHLFTPEHRILPLMCFGDLLASEDQRQNERPYENVYGLWTQEMQRLYPHREALRKTTPKSTTPARIFLNAYKVIAEEIISYHPDNVTAVQLNCTDAARIHLMTATKNCPRVQQPAIFVSRETPERYTGCVVWVADLQAAQALATELLNAFASLRKHECTKDLLEE